MRLKPVTVVDSIAPEVFKKEFYQTNTPVIIKALSRDWPAKEKWSWELKTGIKIKMEVAVPLSK